MEDSHEELIKTFKKLERKLKAEIKKLPASIQDSNDAELLKQRIKAYIEKLNEVEKILNEYVETAAKIEKLTGSKNAKEDIANAVVNLRPTEKPEEPKPEQPETEEKEEDDGKTSDEVEQIVVNGKVLGVRRKKNNKNTREM